MKNRNIPVILRKFAELPKTNDSWKYKKPDMEISVLNENENTISWRNQKNNRNNKQYSLCYWQKKIVNYVRR